MITKDDCMGLLVRLGDSGVQVNPYIKKLLVSQTVPMEVLQFISKNNGIEATNFYEMLRKNHNKKKSPLYLNIVKGEFEGDEVITTLSALLTQIGLFSRKIADRETFYKEVRAVEITKVLQNYFETEDLSKCISLLNLIKSDLLVLEYINGRREKE